MACAYIFAAIALISLPGVLATRNVLVVVAWVAQTFLQLVLLSVIMVGQKIQADATISHVKKHLDAHHESLKSHIESLVATSVPKVKKQ